MSVIRLMLTVDLPYSSPGESEDLLLGGGRDHRSGPRNLSSAGSQGNVPACGAQGEGVCHGVGGKECPRGQDSTLLLFLLLFQRLCPLPL